MQQRRVTPAEEVGEVTRFALPEMDGPIVGHEDLPPEEAPKLTPEDIAALRKQAWTEAFRQGLKEGYEEGRAKGLADAQAAARRLLGVMDQLGDPLAAVDDAVVEAVSDLALLVARHLVRRELHVEPGEIVGLVRETLQHLPVAPRATRIRLHPEDEILVREAFALKEDARGWKLEADPLITRGGCIVETDVSRVDATVEARLATIASRMLGSGRGPQHAD